MKRAFVVLSLALLALWPATQHALFHSHAVGAWKLFGLGVYCRPKLDLRFELTVDGRAVDLRTLSPRTREAFVALHGRTRDLGMLASPRAAACSLLRDEDATRARIVRAEEILQPDGTIRTRRDTWIFEGELCSRSP